MIISNSHRFIFCHIHKTGGESITSALEPFMGWNDLVIGTGGHGTTVSTFLSKFGIFKHSTAAEIRKVVGDRVWDDYLTFAFVRHPFDRTRSFYHYLEKVAAAQNRGGIRQRLSYWRKDPNRAPWRWPAMQAYLGSRSISDFIRHPGFLGDYGGQNQAGLLSDPQTNTMLVREIARFENIEADFKRIAGLIGIPGAELPKVNTSANSHARRHEFSAEDISYLAKTFAQDLETFGYKAEKSA